MAAPTLKKQGLTGIGTDVLRYISGLPNESNDDRILGITYMSGYLWAISKIALYQIDLTARTAQVVVAPDGGFDERIHCLANDGANLYISWASYAGRLNRTNGEITSFGGPGGYYAWDGNNMFHLPQEGNQLSRVDLVTGESTPLQNELHPGLNDDYDEDLRPIERPPYSYRKDYSHRGLVWDGSYFYSASSYITSLRNREYYYRLYQIDPETGTYTGLYTLGPEDFAIRHNDGPFYDVITGATARESDFAIFNGEDDLVYSIDVQQGVVKKLLVDAKYVSRGTGTGWDDSDKLLEWDGEDYWTVVDSRDTTDGLVTTVLAKIDGFSGKLTVVDLNVHGFGIPNAPRVVTPRDFAWDGTNLYMLLSTSDGLFLYTLDRATGRATRVGSTPYTVGINGITANKTDGTLYAIVASSLLNASEASVHTVNKQSGLLTKVVDILPTPLSGTAKHKPTALPVFWGGHLWVAYWFSGGFIYYSINLTTGDLAPSGSYLNRFFSFDAPEPNDLAFDGTSVLLASNDFRADFIRFNRHIRGAPVREYWVTEGAQLNLDLREVFSEATSYRVRYGYTLSSWLTISGNYLTGVAGF